MHGRPGLGVKAGMLERLTQAVIDQRAGQPQPSGLRAGEVCKVITEPDDDDDVKLLRLLL